MSSQSKKVLGTCLALPFKLACIGLMIAIPAVGVWVSSSLAVYANRSIALPLLAGLLMFPVLPLLWEAFAAWRHRRKGTSSGRVLTTFDRLILRTVVLNGLCIGVLLCAYPQTAFTALSTRGDWMLAGAQGPRATRVRRGLFRAADTLQWIYDAARENPYDKYDDGSADKHQPASQTRSGTGKDTAPEQQQRPAPTKPSAGETKQPAGQEQEQQQQQQAEQPQKASAQDRPAARPHWPQPGALHHLVRELPASAEASPETLGRYFKQRAADPLSRARAVHDYVAHRIAYDVPAYRNNTYPPQSPEHVLRQRKGVCAGYARLFHAIGTAAGLETVYVVGDARAKLGSVGGAPHAWNAVKLRGAWYLLDVTWDSGYVNGGTFTRQLVTHYFLTPPRVFGLNHFPDDPRWQLRDKPLSRGAFNRQPMLRPAFYAHHLVLLSPKQPQVTVQGSVVVDVDNPEGRHLLATFAPVGQEAPKRRCKVRRGAQTRVTCTIPQEGSFDVRLFASQRRYSTYEWVGTVKVNNQGR